MNAKNWPTAEIEATQNSMPQDKQGSRWWEYYAVRYALGVGVGTPIIGLLWKRYQPLFQPSIRLDSPFHTAVSAVLWGAAGMAFCYIASAPMLTFHSVRRSLSRNTFTVTLLLLGVIAVSVLRGPSPSPEQTNTQRFDT